MKSFFLRVALCAEVGFAGGCALHEGCFAGLGNINMESIK